MPSQQPSQQHTPATGPIRSPELQRCLADLDAATAATAAAIASPDATKAAVIRAAEAEQAALVAVERHPGGVALLKAGTW
jgi:hypothetical protein